MPGPRSATATTAEAPSRPSSTRTSTGAPAACSFALSRRLPTIRSIRRGSDSTTTRFDGIERTASGRRAVATVVTSSTRSTGSVASCSAPASKREISIRSSTRIRSRATSATSSSPARRLASGIAPRSLAQDRRLGDERRERRPKLVRDVGDEAPVVGLGRLEPADRLLERRRHPVERLGPVAELVGGGDRRRAPRGRRARSARRPGMLPRRARGRRARRPWPRRAR